MKSKLFVIAILVSLVAVACSPTTETVEAGTSSGGNNSSILFADDFSDTGSGWDRSEFDGGLTDYENEGYRIFVNAENWSAWANPSRNFTDTRVTVIATKIAGDDDNEFGIICRHANVDNYYLATISSDGFYGFLRRLNGESLTLLNMENMLPTEAINQGSASNTIRLDCVGNTLTLYVNGTFVGETTDDEISSGDVGLYAGTFSVPGTDILFDDFVVTDPGN